MSDSAAKISKVSARAFTIPTDKPEADGTFSWTKTTLIIAEIVAGGKTGLGYTYADACLVKLIDATLGEVIQNHDALDIPGANAALWKAVRNLGRSGLAACAISALDLALWDLKAKLLGLPLASLLGRRREAAVIYGSGGFTSYDDKTLRQQLAGWVERDGCGAVKMKIGSEPERDPARIQAARDAIGKEAGLYVDANGAFDPRGALDISEILHEYGVSWYEEPVSSDDREGMAFVRAHIGPRIDIAAGEYTYTLDDVRMMLKANAVDVQQVDITRAGGVTAFMQSGALCDAHHIDLSGHCAPSAHVHAACAAPRFRNLEWFHDHVRIEHMLFDGAPVPRDGKIRPDLSRPGLGLTLKEKEAEAYVV
jgi:L-alanine-DL-glutamate epimerase-like enolase superfamily enzyme